MTSFIDSLTNAKHPIVLAQYKRDDFGQGDEPQLHWALHVLTSSKRLSGPSFQVIDRIYQDERGKQWSLFYNPADALIGNGKCLGGLQVGTVPHREVSALVDAVRAHEVKPKFEEWNCRDFVLELFELFKERGWMRKELADVAFNQEDLIPDLKVSSSATISQARERRPFVPYVMYYP